MVKKKNLVTHLKVKMIPDGAADMVSNLARIFKCSLIAYVQGLEVIFNFPCSNQALCRIGKIHIENLSAHIYVHHMSCIHSISTVINFIESLNAYPLLFKAESRLQGSSILLAARNGTITWRNY